jgi:polyhydroxyalkanoate synthase
MHSFLLQNMYLNNELVQGKLKICDVVMDITKVKCPMYLFAAQKDHIVPWGAAYKTIYYVKGEVRFVLGASGHTAGVVNPVSSEKRNYWVNDNIEQTADDWFQHAKEKSGSWWKDFSVWLQKYSGSTKKAKQTLGNQSYKPICNAPGEFVMAKSMSIIEAECI